jgi:excisionase family DNA binding protein
MSLQLVAFIGVCAAFTLAGWVTGHLWPSRNRLAQEHDQGYDEGYRHGRKAATHDAALAAATGLVPDAWVPDGRAARWAGLPDVPQPETQPLVSLTEAASVVGVGRTTAYDLAKTNRFPVEVLKVGGRYRVRTRDLRTWLGLQS